MHPHATLFGLLVLATAAASPASAQRLPRVPIPPGNELTPAKVRLGAVLFWDEQLSATREVACGTCHMPEAGGSDVRAWLDADGALHPGPDGVFGTPDDSMGSIGVRETSQLGGAVRDALFGSEGQATRRRPRTVLAAAYMTATFWDGRASDTFFDPDSGEEVLPWAAALETQSLKPLLSTVEMGAHGRTFGHVARDLITLEPLALSPKVPADLGNWIAGRSYPELFEEAFGDDGLTAAQFAMAVASYQRTLIPDQAPVLRRSAGLTDLELEGFRVFHAKGCAECHEPDNGLFTDQGFHFIGVSDPALDGGLADVTGEDSDRGLYLTPTLLGVELRAPYFHDGSKADLNEVLDFYSRGGDFGRRRSREIVPANLTPAERSALLAFLGRPLTDPRLITASGPFERPLLSWEAEGGRHQAPIRGISGPAATALPTTASLVQATPYTGFVAWLPGRAETLTHRPFVQIARMSTNELMEMSFGAPAPVPYDPVLVGARVYADLAPLFANRSLRSSVTLSLTSSIDD